jgi:DNA-binding response OmpR family regulator
MTGKKILIIDDEKLLVRSTCMVLGHYGYDVRGALGGEEGLKAALEFGPEVILLDIMMPGMDGWQVLEKLKQDAKTRSIPVVIFTAREYSNGKALALEKGAADFVAKPFEPQELAVIIDDVTGSSRAKA